MTGTNSDTDTTSVVHVQAPVVERLILEFGASFTRDAIARTVAGSIADLAEVPIADMPGSVTERHHTAHEQERP
jgi:hypothetical protein